MVHQRSTQGNRASRKTRRKPSHPAVKTSLQLQPGRPSVPCFFCTRRPATAVFTLRGGWPECVKPMPLDAGLAICGPCSDLDADEKLVHIMEYHNDLRRAHNIAVLARQAGVN
jgi:hypothetical protein